ncbi:hypothetical protein N180_17370 [Pedobacter antarcticus 4BY]|uniref:Uncharacterized protein n=1 Tax=Pedobacter antarcticus 4BY TaxID=1358423 RepID=A0A081PFY7_9SPHI|nr:hypothetical protein N180_17370 [Pedobacter antarcticus 4BY]
MKDFHYIIKLTNLNAHKISYKKTKDDLEVLIKVASDYAYIIGSIKNSKSVEQPTDWFLDWFL